jgi:hypothetical protein
MTMSGGQQFLSQAGLVCSLAAQVKARMWMRDGEGISVESLNYSSLPQCIHYRDADIKALQVRLSYGYHNSVHSPPACFRSWISHGVTRLDYVQVVRAH